MMYVVMLCVVVVYVLMVYVVMMYAVMMYVVMMSCWPPDTSLPDDPAPGAVRRELPAGRAARLQARCRLLRGGGWWWIGAVDLTNIFARYTCRIYIPRYTCQIYIRNIFARYLPNIHADILARYTFQKYTRQVYLP